MVSAATPIGQRHGELTSKVKSYQRLGLIILGSLTLSCILSPIIYSLLQYLRGLSPNLDSMLDFPFYRVMNRVVLVMSLLMLYLERKRLEIRSLTSMGLKRKPDWRRVLWRGWLLGVCSLSLMVLIMLFLGARRVETDFTGPLNLCYELVKIFLTGAVVALIEEVFFRGFILQSLIKDMRRWPAIFSTSIFFAIVHFFHARTMPDPTGFDPLSGFMALGYFFQPLLDPIQVMPGFVGLFLVGVVLAYAYLWSGSLYMPIGLHAGWVFAVKGEGLFLYQIEDVVPWFFGDGRVVTGVFGWLMLLVMLTTLRKFIPQKQPTLDS